MALCINSLRKLRRLKCIIFLASLVFVGLGTFYWSLWEIPWLSADSPEIISSVDGELVDETWTVEEKPTVTLRPVRPTCIKDSTELTIPKHYCLWNKTGEDCSNVLKDALQGKESWVFLGDSGMANIPYLLSEKDLWPFENGGNLPNITTRRNSCQNLVYYGLPPPQEGWIPPDPTLGEGPIARGIDNPYCMDCTKCWNVMMKSSSTPTKYVEYLVVEYARDVSVPSLLTKTTQETAIYYLNRQKDGSGATSSPPAVCIASAGINDAAIKPAVTETTFLQNADKYLALLQRTCHSVIWITIHAVVESTTIPQTNCKLKQWNSAFLDLVSQRNYDNVYVMDVWDESFESDYRSEIMLGESYYTALASFFKSIMVATS